MQRAFVFGLCWLFTMAYHGPALHVPNESEIKQPTHKIIEKEAEESLSGDYDFLIPADAQSGTIPFIRAGNLIIIQATVDSTRGNFILDTGAPGLILNLTYFRQYKASSKADVDAGGITGYAAGGSPTLVKQFNLGPFTYSEVNAGRVNLGHIENTKGIKIMGLMGAGLFKRYEMLIDYEQQVIHFHRAAKKEKSGYKSFYLDKKAEYETLPIRLQEGKLITKMAVGKQMLNFVLDTGAETNILDSRLPKSVFSNVIMDRKISLVGTGQKPVEAWYGRLFNASLGQVKIDSMDVLVTSLQQMSEAFGQNIDGMLGYAFLSKQKTGINFLNNELYLWK